MSNGWFLSKVSNILPAREEQLALLVHRFKLKQQLQKVLNEEKRRQRVILRAIAGQLLVSQIY